MKVDSDAKPSEAMNADSDAKAKTMNVDSDAKPSETMNADSDAKPDPWRSIQTLSPPKP